ncbi:unnamed protein product [Clavelina lepadiformis]|uniref:ShKT domain-containing protein n=1 Tax=Clavelina lepadiformis TaxID=159417 RepID=A0ABP0EWM8_CLALP
MKILVLFALIVCMNCVCGEGTTTKTCSDDCKDAKETCTSSKIKQMCYDHIFSRVIRKLCKFSCNLCQPCEKSSCDPENDPCKDDHSLCSIDDAQDYCKATEGRMAMFIQEKCKKTCEFCQPCQQNSNEIRTFSNSCDQDCKDEDNDCSYYADKYCKSTRYQSWMKRRCAKSCGVCKPCDQAPTTSAEKTTTPVPSTTRETTQASTTTVETTSQLVTTTPAVIVEADLTGGVNFIDESCEANCLHGSCFNRGGHNCKCENRKSRSEVPTCRTNCQVYCPKPYDYIGEWTESCSGKFLCTCNINRGLRRGAKCT